MLKPSRFSCSRYRMTRTRLTSLLALAACAGLPLLQGCGADSRAASAPVMAAVTSARYTFTDGQRVAITPALTLKLDRINDSR